MSHKQAKVSGRIRKILSTLIVREVADPRLQGLTVTDVEIDSELMSARVYVNALGEEDREAEVMMALERAKGFLRREVAHRMSLRRAPLLTFRWDASLERGERISKILAELDIPPAVEGEVEVEPAEDDLGDDAEIFDDEDELMDMSEDDDRD